MRSCCSVWCRCVCVLDRQVPKLKLRSFRNVEPRFAPTWNKATGNWTVLPDIKVWYNEAGKTCAPGPDPTHDVVGSLEGQRPCMLPGRSSSYHASPAHAALSTLRMHAQLQLQPGTCPFPVLRFWGKMTIPNDGAIAYRRDFPSTTRI